MTLPITQIGRFIRNPRARARRSGSLVVVAILLSAWLAAGCSLVDGTHVQCDCASRSVAVDSPGVPVSQLLASDACSYPYCSVPTDAGACSHYTVQLDRPGTCHITAIAADGRQTTADVDVQVTGSAGCCGEPIGAAHPVTLTFAPPATDGAAADADAPGD
jgi:hypothetical protein